MGPLSITCRTIKSCSNVTTEFYTCQKFCSEIDQGLQISYIVTHNQCNCLFVHIEQRWRKWQRCSSEKCEVSGSKLVVDMNILRICWMLEAMRLENWLNFRVQSLCKNTRCECNVPLTISPCRDMVRTRDYCVPRTTKYSPSHWCDIPLSISYRMLCI